MSLSEEQLKEIAEQFKSILSLEELDELERQYNAMYKRLKEEYEQTGSIENVE
jgi:hypothetical protein